MMSVSYLLKPGRIGGVETRNRVIRSATGESMADPSGVVGSQFIELHRRLALGGVGLIFTGHCYVHSRGCYDGGMTGLHDDRTVEPLSRATHAVHAVGVPIFAQLNHAGSQSRMPLIEPLAPSAVPNPQTGRSPREASESEIHEVVEAFGRAALRARLAGFDGVHIHAAHGYLLSEFLSPHSNRRTDSWGGSLEHRQRLLFSVIESIKAHTGGSFPVTVKLGILDFVQGGLEVADGVATARRLDSAGVSAIEVSAGLTTAKMESSVQYVGVSKRRALKDKLVHRIFAEGRPEGYFRVEAELVKKAVSCPVILVGGLRSIECMETVLEQGTADFVSLARPLIREPDLVDQISKGRRGFVDCTSCNICIQHDGVHPLRCWRKTNRDLLTHAYYRFSGKLH